jgi:hypothetical protein
MLMRGHCRGRGDGRGGQWEAGAHPEPARVVLTGFQLTAMHGDPFAHPDQTVARTRSVVARASVAVVVDLDLDRIGVVADGQLGLGGLGVAQRVGERFLGDAVGRHADAGQDLARLAFDVEVDGHACGHLGGEVTQVVQAGLGRPVVGVGRAGAPAAVTTLDELGERVTALTRLHIASGEHVHPNHGVALLAGLHGLAAGLIACDDPAARLAAVVANGGDTDTVAAICGSVLGARRGSAWIPATRLLDAARLQRWADGLAVGKPPETTSAFLAREAELTRQERAFPNTAWRPPTKQTRVTPGVPRRRTAARSRPAKTSAASSDKNGVEHPQRELTGARTGHPASAHSVVWTLARRTALTERDHAWSTDLPAVS